jgi:hypothetical protein
MRRLREGSRTVRSNDSAEARVARRDVFLRCDPATAFDLLADVRNEARWNKLVSAAELRTEGPVGEGSRFVTVYLGQDNDISLREFDRPERMVVAGTNSMMDIETTYTLTAEDGAPGWS